MVIELAIPSLQTINTTAKAKIVKLTLSTFSQICQTDVLMLILLPYHHLMALILLFNILKFH
jgi:hypothetical protein